MKSLRFYPFLVLYLLINLLFIYKYGLRQEFIPISYLLIFYVLMIMSLPHLIKKIKIHFSKISFFTVAALFFVATILINIAVDGNRLNVDRWSAMDVSLAALLRGAYPYTAVDHLNGRSSNLPALLLLGLPAYLIGNVGFLQSFSFLFFVYVLLKTLETYRGRLFGLLLLVSSSAFLWEVSVKSDLMSNFIFLLGFITLWHKKYANKIADRPLLVGSISGFIFYTRLISFIPLTLFLFQDFVWLTLRKKAIFLAAAFGMVATLTFVVFRNCPSFEVFSEYNPFTLQNRQLPMLVSFTTMLVPFFFSRKSIQLLYLMRLCVVFLFIPVLLAFLFSLINNGFYNLIHESTFDISYFNFVTPFVVYYLALYYERQLLKATATNPALLPADRGERRNFASEAGT